MKKILNGLMTLLMVLSIAFIAEVGSQNGNPLSVQAQTTRQVTVKRTRRPGIIRSVYRGGKYVGKQVWNGTKWVSAKTWQGTKYAGKKTVQGAKFVGKKTYKGGRMVTSRAKKIIY